MLRLKRHRLLVTATALGLALGVPLVSAAQADPYGRPNGWHGDGWHNNGPRYGYHGGVVVVRPHYYYPPPVYVIPAPPPAYYVPPPQPMYAVPQPAPVATTIVCRDSGQGAALGAAAGGTAGAILGATSAHGPHKWAAGAGGAILGMLLGGSIGHAADSFNRSCAAEAVAYAPVGQPVQWVTPGYSTQYQVTPIRQYGYQGTTCREYQVNAAIDGRWQQVHGTACLQPDGSWQVVN